jgi:hypothetical protein
MTYSDMMLKIFIKAYLVVTYASNASEDHVMDLN